MIGDKDQNHHKNMKGQPSFWEANWEIFRISIPAIASCIGMKVMEFLNVMYSTKLGDQNNVIIIGLANLLTDSFTLSVMMGLNWAL